MSLSHLYEFTMEKTSLNSVSPSFQLSDFIVDIFFLHLFADWVISIQKYLSRSQTFLQSKLDSFSNLKVLNEEKKSGFELSTQKESLKQKVDHDSSSSLSREEVEKVMGSLRIFSSPESEKLNEKMGFDELSRLFEEREPSLEEVKEAFYVFDENRDGFIDARDLQRVLSVLGMKEGSELENCNKMIRTFDENGDGRIDFNDFVKIMENSFF